MAGRRYVLWWWCSVVLGLGRFEATLAVVGVWMMERRTRPTHPTPCTTTDPVPPPAPNHGRHDAAAGSYGARVCLDPTPFRPPPQHNPTLPPPLKNQPPVSGGEPWMLGLRAPAPVDAQEPMLVADDVRSCVCASPLSAHTCTIARRS